MSSIKSKSGSFNKSGLKPVEKRKSVDKTSEEPKEEAALTSDGTQAEEPPKNGELNGSDDTNGYDNRMDNLRNKFEAGESNQTSKQKQPARVRYAGLQSAKTKFMEDINRVETSTKTSSERRASRRITPPREPSYKSELENSPKPRDPNIVYSGEDNQDDEIIMKQVQTKSLLAKFKEIEQGKSMDEDKTEKQVDVDPTLVENNRNIRAKWKDMEKGKSPEAGRSRQGSETKDEIMVNARELRERFLREASESEQKRSTTKLNPLEEIQELAKRERNVIYENSPQARSDDIVSYSEPDQNAAPLTTNAKQLREKFMNGNSSNGVHKEKAPIDIKSEYGGVFENEPEKLEGVVRSGEMDEDWKGKGNWTSQAKQKFIEASTLKKEKQKLQLELAEGGIYESNPVRLENVVRSNSEEQQYLPTDTVKSNKQRLLDWKEQNSQVKCSSGVRKFDSDVSNGGIYENQPAPSQADISSAHLNNEQQTLSTGKFASEAKRKFLERQKQEEEENSKKGPKDIINIWDDLCQDSGVFENDPTPPPKDLARCHDYEAYGAYVQSQASGSDAVSQ